jgi:UDP-GlcNAc:undecaprenyl-phosphate GlcNAc-1-phosphate transferase
MDRRTVITGGPILTMGPVAEVEAIALLDERILAAGTIEDCRAAAGRGANEIDLGGRTLMPGFVDAHTHPLMLGQCAAWVDCAPPEVTTIDALVTALGHRFQLLDHPDLVRRFHKVARPRLGGTAVLGSVTLTLLLLEPLIASDRPQVQFFGPTGPALLLGASILFWIGVWDDLRGTPPVMKVLGQLAAAFLLVRAGLVVEAIALTPSSEVIHLGFWGLPLTLLWLVGVPNAMNLIDGLDGLAATCATIAILTLIAANTWVSPDHHLLLTAAVVGALGAFTHANWHPARLFLGDSGSLPIGLFLGVYALTAATDARGVTYPLIPVVALGYPLLDTGVAMLRRWLRGAPISRADGRHVHHQLIALGFRHDDAVRLIALGGLTLAAVGLSLTLASTTWTLLLLTGAAVVLVVLLVRGARWLGYGEFTAVGVSLRGGLGRARAVIRARIQIDEVARGIATAPDATALAGRLTALVDGRTLVDAALLPMDEAPALRVRNGEAFTLVAQPIIPPGAAAPAATFALWLTAEGIRERTGGRIMEILTPVLRAWYAGHPLAVPSARAVYSPVPHHLARTT